ncbi:hypothetical protein [Micromonospora marina]|uniref:hypothetical protein n=1 Tax=Micromonospora marina TaxID=307120 RepID=UPI003D758EA6
MWESPAVVLISGIMAAGESTVADGPALRQLRLCYDLAASAADRYASAGFAVVLQDVILGADLPAVVGRIRHRPLAVVVLAPRAEVVAARERNRSKKGYGDWPVADLVAGFRYRHAADRALAGHLRPDPGGDRDGDPRPRVDRRADRVRLNHARSHHHGTRRTRGARLDPRAGSGARPR